VFNRLTTIGKIAIFVLLILILGAVGYFTGQFDSFLGKGKLQVNQPGALPAKSDMMQISLDEWIGWKPILDANGGLETKKGSIYDSLGLKLKINVINDATQSSTALINGSIVGAGYTVNRYAFLNEKLKTNSTPVKMVYLVNASAGGDGIIAKDGINSIEGLKGKKIALPQASEAQVMTEWLLSASSLTAEEINGIRRQFVFFNTPDDAAKAFFAGQVDAAATWQPYLSQAQQQGGCHILFSTKNATNLILDGIVFRQDYINKYSAQVRLFIEGAIKAASLYEKEFTPIKNTFPLFASETDANIKAMTGDAILLDHSNNLSRESVAVKLYEDMAKIWKTLGAHADPSDAGQAFDFSLLKALADKFPAAISKSPAFTEQERLSAQVKDQALITNRLTINFTTGTATLTENDKKALDNFVGKVKLLDRVVIQIEGNTDNVGNAQSNEELSYKRALSVKNYLQWQHGVDPSRFVIIGNGQNKPVVDNNTEAGRSANRRTDVYLKTVGK